MRTKQQADIEHNWAVDLTNVVKSIPASKGAGRYYQDLVKARKQKRQLWFAGALLIVLAVIYLL